MSNDVLPYLPRSFDDLQARSQVLALGIEKFAHMLVHEGGYYYGRPWVKWVFVPHDRRDSPRDEEGLNPLDHAHYRLLEQVKGFSKDMQVVSMGSEPLDRTIWVWEDVVPSIDWLNFRLGQMFEAAQLSDCYIEGWTYEDEDAWQYGLSKLIDEAGFDKSLTCPGQR